MARLADPDCRLARNGPSASSNEGHGRRDSDRLPVLGIDVKGTTNRPQNPRAKRVEREDAARGISLQLSLAASAVSAARSIGAFTRV